MTVVTFYFIAYCVCVYICVIVLIQAFAAKKIKVMLCYICSWFCEQVLRARTSLHVAVKLEQTPSSAPTRLRLLVRNVDYASCMHSTKNIAGTLRCLQKEMVTYSH